MATDESVAIANRRLAKIQRGETREMLLHRAACTIFVTSVTMAILMIVALAFHYLAPPAWHFMTDSQRRDVQNILLAIIGTKAVTAAGERWIKDGD